MTTLQKIVKRLIDLFLSAAMILLLTPFFLIVSLLIVIESKGGIIFKQKRAGKNGIPFDIYKFRSMVPNAENLGAGWYFDGPDDPRITRVGRLLRRFSIDELPQLFNVLKGDMSIIGPRPALIQHLPCYSDEQKKRLDVKPGITGWSQVNGRTNLSWSKKIEHDIWYIENYSLRLELLILLKTVKVVFTDSGINYNLTAADIEDFSNQKGDQEKMKIPLSAPDIGDMEKNLVMEVLDSNNLSLGPMLEQFEKEFTVYTGAKYAVGVSSGTGGLHLLVNALNLKAGDEVITTPFSFVASSNCLLYERVKPVFVDIDIDTMNIDVNLIEEMITPKTKAILPVHVFGRPVPMDIIRTIADKHNLKIIEDACEAIGAEYAGRKVGTFGAGGVFAFYPNKQITSGEGGMIVTDDEELAAACRSMRHQGRNPGAEWLCHDRLGFNYRLDEMSAALGLGQLKRVEEILEKRRWVASKYCEKLKDCEEITLPLQEGTDVQKSWFVFVIRLNPSIDRDNLISYLKKAGIETRNYFYPIHLQSFYMKQFGYRRGDYPVAEAVAESTLALPFHNNLTEQEINYVAMVLQEAVHKCRKG